MDRLSEGKSVIPKEEGFVVPENYFESLHENILKKMDAEETKVIRLNPYKKYYYAAASIAAIVLVVLGLNWNTAEALTFDDLAASDIETYFENNEFDLSTYEIAEVIPVDELEINDVLENRFAEENMLEYLDENIDDFEALNLEDDE
ncbi:hypothetical protein [Maribacter halichondriae]|uniref:hypothetical protein n=1 Tax=Maribacter halichondriae TaxID=2980554 RepID=UPI002359EAFF|nr:hypothetical protein [Maribacter sp. Hal144]